MYWEDGTDINIEKIIGKTNPELEEYLEDEERKLIRLSLSVNDFIKHTEKRIKLRDKVDYLTLEEAWDIVENSKEEIE